MNSPAPPWSPGPSTPKSLLTLATAALAVWLIAAASGSSAAAVPKEAAPGAQPMIGLPVSNPTLIGSSPAESPGETWGFGTNGAGFQLIRYVPSAGWQLAPAPLAGDHKPVGKFRPAIGPLAGRTTPKGGVAIVGDDESKTDQMLVRDPGGRLEQAPTLTTEPKEAAQPAEENALLKAGETLFPAGGEGVLMATVDQEDNKTSVFLVPHESGSGIQSDVLFYDGGKWTRDPICTDIPSGSKPEEPCAKPGAGFKVLAIDATSAQNAWMLAQSGSTTEGIVLLSREIGGKEERWSERSLGAAGSLGARFARSGLSLENASHQHTNVRISALTNGQPLTVTDRGVWVDGQLSIEAPAQPTTTSDFTLYYEIGKDEVSASWCSPPAEVVSLWKQEPLCTEPLESSLPSGAYRSFAWSEGGPYGERVITGLGNGVSLSLRGNAFTRVLGAGGEGGTSAGAAFSSPQEGWLADRNGGPLTHLTTSPAPDLVQAWPVPFRRPLTAIASQPGATPGDIGAQAIAIGQEGQVAHYIPSQGWVPEALLNSSGTAQTPDLRGVAWPEPERAYAVGTNGAMWLWQQATGLWEPDPARPPNLFLANFTGIAFNPGNPASGFAVGQQGLLLSYGKTWEQITTEETAALEHEVKMEERNLNLTSIAFAGGEALITYQAPNFHEGKREYLGGVLCNSGQPGSRWQVDTAAESALPAGAIPVRVAGLPDGGAVLADSGGDVIERQGPGSPSGCQQSSSPWQASAAGPANGFPVALAPFREGGTLRAVVSVDTSGGGGLGQDLFGDEALQQPPPEGQAAVATAPYALPSGGFLLRETSSGWKDEEHQDYPKPNRGQSLPTGQTGLDWSEEPDAVLALALNPDNGQGWAVGGQTGELNESVGQEYIEDIQTAGVMRYPAGSGPPAGFSPSPISVGSGNATFAIGGNAQCASACADLANDQIGPDAWLSNAVARAAGTPGVRDFIYTGPRLAPGLASAGGDANAFQREESRYAQLLSSPGESMGVYAAPSETDVDAEGNLNAFTTGLGAHAPTGTAPTGTGAPPAGSGAYAFVSPAASGKVWVIVLDYSRPSLGEKQQCWLGRQLAWAKARSAPAIVIGNRGMSGGENVAADASQVIPTLVDGAPPQSAECKQLFAEEKLTEGSPSAQAGASAYFFDAPEQNRTFQIAAGGASIPTFGSGTLSYVNPPAKINTQFLGASSFLLSEVEVAKRSATTNRAPVLVKLIPDISELALDATNGVLLRRSHAALFTALARIPHAGAKCAKEGAACLFTPDPYIPIPSTCQGATCSTGLLPEYSFSSSNPDIGDFVEPDPASPEGTTVLQGANGKPIQDSHSGLFCAYNPGTTTVTVRTGGLAYSEPVTVLSGSAEQPCGTVPLRHPPAPAQQEGLPTPLPAPAPSPSPTPTGTLPPPPPPPAVVPLIHQPVKHPPTPVPTVPAQAALLFPLPPIVPPPAPNPVRPTPPSGTAQVSQTVGVAEYEREEQGATEMVHHMAAYKHPEEAPMPTWPLGLVLVAAAAGVGTRRRFGSPRPVYAHARTSTRRPR